MPVHEISPRGHRIVYDAAGSGPTVVLVAGLSMWRGQWGDAEYIAALAEEFRILRVDTLGHGDSAKPHDPADYHPAEVAGDLIAVLDAEATASAVVSGYSSGAQIALGLASINVERVRAVICGSGGWRNEHVAEQAWCQPIAELVRGPDGLQRFWAGIGFDDPDQVSTALGHNDAEAIAAALEGSTVWRPDYAGLRVPVLSYSGDREHLEHNDALMEQLGAESHVLQDAEHLDCFNRRDAVLDLVLPFLRRHAQ